MKELDVQKKSFVEDSIELFSTFSQVKIEIDINLNAPEGKQFTTSIVLPENVPLPKTIGVGSTIEESLLKLQEQIFHATLLHIFFERR